MAEASKLAQRQMLERKEIELSLEEESLELFTKNSIVTAKEKLSLDVKAEGSTSHLRVNLLAASTTLMWSLFSARLPVLLMMFVWKKLSVSVGSSKHSFEAKLLISQAASLADFVLKVR